MKSACFSQYVSDAYLGARREEATQAQHGGHKRKQYSSATENEREFEHYKDDCKRLRASLKSLAYALFHPSHFLSLSRALAMNVRVSPYFWTKRLTN